LYYNGKQNHTISKEGKTLENAVIRKISGLSATSIPRTDLVLYPGVAEKIALRKSQTEKEHQP